MSTKLKSIEKNNVYGGMYYYQPGKKVAQNIASFNESKDSSLLVKRGQMTFDAEGLESPGSRFHSRIAHQPTLNSGITIGRGYDMKFRTHSEVKRDLLLAGVDEERANSLAAGAGQTGQYAKSWLQKNKSILPEISKTEQKKLFSEVTYPWYIKETERLVSLWTKNNPEITWNNLDKTKQDFLIDLRYRGDLTKRSFKQLEQSLEYEDNRILAYKVSTSELFKSVPKNRQEARVSFLETEKQEIKLDNFNSLTFENDELGNAVISQFIKHLNLAALGLKNRYFA